METFIGTDVNYHQRFPLKKICFSAVRVSKLKMKNAIISFDGVHPNNGRAMNISNGVFTAPLVGTYCFYFYKEMKKSVGNGILVHLQVNGFNVNASNKDEYKSRCPTVFYREDYCCNYLQRLKIGDEVMSLFSKKSIMCTQRRRPSY